MSPGQQKEPDQVVLRRHPKSCYHSEHLSTSCSCRALRCHHLRSQGWLQHNSSTFRAAQHSHIVIALPAGEYRALTVNRCWLLSTSTKAGGKDHACCFRGDGNLRLPGSNIVSFHPEEHYTRLMDDTVKNNLLLLLKIIMQASDVQQTLPPPPFSPHHPVSLHTAPEPRIYI